MRTRLLDMRLMMGAILRDEETPSESFLESRYQMQEESISLIEKRYLGSAVDVQKLKEEFKKLQEVNARAVEFEQNNTKENISRYLEENVTPQFDEVDACLTNIIAYSNSEVMALETNISQIAQNTIFTFFSLLLLIFGSSFYFSYREKKNIRELEYRDMLFDRLSRNIDDVFYICLLYTSRTASASSVFTEESSNSPKIFCAFSVFTSISETPSLL